MKRCFPYHDTLCQVPSLPGFNAGDQVFASSQHQAADDGGKAATEPLAEGMIKI